MVDHMGGEKSDQDCRYLDEIYKSKSALTRGRREGRKTKDKVNENGNGKAKGKNEDKTNEIRHNIHRP